MGSKDFKLQGSCSKRGTQELNHISLRRARKPRPTYDYILYSKTIQIEFHIVNTSNSERQMTNRIQLLDDNIISQIAAGEVIEGPSAVIKELCENSLDAGALSITCAIEDGGKKLIRITDDGFGMSSADLKTSFMRHSTSKIRCAEDLTTVGTLGFRGEALASIASIARVEAQTREHNSTDGSKIIVEGGEELEFSPCGCAEGTQISVKDLFFNIPVRKKFLKTDISESRKCVNTFRSLALSRPNVDWKFFNNDKLRDHFLPAPLKDRFSEFVGDKYDSGLLEVDFIEGDYKIFGYVSGKDYSKRSRDSQFLYLNGRRITDQKLSMSIYSAYQGMLDRGDFPYFVLFLEMDPEMVDVNVHPTKMEVRFREERETASFVRRAAHRALGIDSIIGKHVSDRYTPGSEYRKPVHYESNRHSPLTAQFNRRYNPEQAANPAFTGGKMTIEEYNILINPPRNDEISEGSNHTFQLYESEEFNADNRFVPEKLFQLHEKYIVAQIKTGIVIFDQHAAHERVLFEKAIRQLSEGRSPSQKLLFPQFLELTSPESEIFEEMMPWLEKMGFSVNPSGPNLFQIETVPAGLKVSDELGLLRGMLEYYTENDERREDNAERIAASFACKAAIKAGDSLTPDEMVALIESLFRTGTSFACPHGRPTYIKMDMKELDRRFGRLG